MTSATTPMPAQAKASVWEDFLDIFYAPSQVYERRKDGKFGLALTLLVIVGALLMYASFKSLEPAYAGEIARGMQQAAEQNPNLTPEQMEAGRGFAGIVMMVSGVLAIPIIVVLSGLALWLLGKLFDSVQSFGQALMVSTYAQVPRFLLGGLLMTIQGFVLDVSSANRVYDVSFSLARFASDGTSELMLAILSRFDVFVIWTTILIGLGLHITGNVPKGKAMIVAALVWILGALPVVLGAMR